MNDLEPAVAAWRRQMLEAGIKSPVPLDELESHLRDDIERKIRDGAGREQAFRLAVDQLGGPGMLSAEFDAIENKERTFMKRGVLIGLGIAGVMVGMAFVMPAVAQYRQSGAMSNGEPWLFLLGSLMTLAGVGAGFRGLIKGRA